MSEDVPKCLFTFVKYVTKCLFPSRSLYAEGERRGELYQLGYNKAISVFIGFPK